MLKRPERRNPTLPGTARDGRLLRGSGNRRGLHARRPVAGTTSSVRAAVDAGASDLASGGCRRRACRPTHFGLLVEAQTRLGVSSVRGVLGRMSGRRSRRASSVGSVCGCGRPSTRANNGFQVLAELDARDMIRAELSTPMSSNARDGYRTLRLSERVREIAEHSGLTVLAELEVRSMTTYSIGRARETPSCLLSIRLRGSPHPPLRWRTTGRTSSSRTDHARTDRGRRALVNLRLVGVVYSPRHVRGSSQLAVPTTSGLHVQPQIVSVPPHPTVPTPCPRSVFASSGSLRNASVQVAPPLIQSDDRSLGQSYQRAIHEHLTKSTATAARVRL